MPETSPKSIGRWFTLPRVFVALSLTFGLGMMIVTPPFESPDEPHHFMRAYQISEGHLLPTFRDNRGGDELPRSIFLITQPFDASQRQRKLTSSAEIMRVLRIPLAPADRQYFEFSNTSAYPPLPYVPQAMAIAIGRLMGLTALQLMYLARLFNLLTWCAGGYLALSLAPGIRRPLFLLMLMPMSMYLAASMSADVVCDSLAILFSVMVWRQIAEPDSEKQISSGRAWLFALMAGGIGFTKFVYLPLTALPILIPSAAFGGRRQKTLVTIGVIAAGVLASILWSLQTPGLDMVANGDSRNLYPRQQIEFLRHNPSASLSVPIQTVRNCWQDQIISFVGKFGWMEAPMSPIACIAYCLFLAWACRPAKHDPTPQPIWDWIVIIPTIVLCSMFVLGLTAYCFWSPLRSPDVKGLQGRYLISLAPAVIILISCLWRRLPQRLRTRREAWKLEFECALVAAAAMPYGIYVIYIWFYTAKPWP
jgi:uncharacterized membrane protein